MHNFRLYLLIDAGGYLKGKDNHSTADAIAQQHGCPVAYYNANEEQELIDRDGSTLPLKAASIAVEARKSYLDQSHSRGADIPQKIDAVGGVTIGRGMLISDFLQAVWRMRGLGNGQRITILINEEVKQLIAAFIPSYQPDDPIELLHLFHYLLENEINRNAPDNLKAFYAETAAVPMMQALQLFLHPTCTQEERIALAQTIEKLWVHQTYRPPRERYGQLPTLKPKEDVVKGEEQARIAQLTALYNGPIALINDGKRFTDLFSCEKAQGMITRAAERYLPHLASEIPSPEEEHQDGMSHVRQETQSEQLSHNEVENQNRWMQETKTLGCVTSRLLREVTNQPPQHAIPFFSLMDHLSYVKGEFTNIHVADSVACAFHDVHATYNIFLWPESKKPNLEDFRLLGRYRTPFDFATFHEDKLVILSEYEAKHARKILVKYDELRYTPFHVKLASQNKGLSPHQRLQLLKVRFLRRESHYSDDELALLSEWLKKFDVVAMRRFFEGVILAEHADAAANYQDSSLQRLFRKLNQLKSPQHKDAPS